MKFTSSTQSISWFRDRFREETLTLRPPYQRKPVWAARQKCYLVESILLELPVPEIYVHRTTDADGASSYAVVDGQQRIRAVLQFLGSVFEPDAAELTGFALDKLDSKSPYLGTTFAELSQADKIKFYSYEFHVRFLITDDEGELRSMFARLNRFLTPLNAQELRNATYTGPFAKMAEKLAEDPWWLQSGLLSRALIRRLADIELVSQLLIGVMHGPQGGSAKIVDSFYLKYEDYDLHEGFPDQRRTKRLFDTTFDSMKRIARALNTDDTRWINKADFYSLFIAVAECHRDVWKSGISASSLRDVATILAEFGGEVDKRLSNEQARVATDVVTYVRAIEKGVNDKKRRADRHIVLVRLLESAPAGRPQK